jgi:ubiquitin
MGAQPDLTQAVCLRFCSYYKPERNEELACGGYVVLEQLAQQGVPMRGAQAEPRDRNCEELLVTTLCTACPFQEHDCDFMENRALPPCGGFLLLAQLLAAKQISIEDVKDPSARGGPAKT